MEYALEVIKNLSIKFVVVTGLLIVITKNRISMLAARICVCLDKLTDFS